jgi:hypothetical protein
MDQLDISILFGSSGFNFDGKLFSNFGRDQSLLFKEVFFKIKIHIEIYFGYINF